MTERRFGSIVEELSNYAPQKDRELFIESRALQLIASAKHLFRLIDESYDAEIAEDLSKRLMSSLKSGDIGKFSRKVRHIKESKRRGKTDV